MSWPLFVSSIVALVFFAFRKRDSEQFMVIVSAFLAVFTIILLPFLGYTHFDNLEITRIFGKEMMVPEDVYFNALQPIIYAFVFGVLLFQYKSHSVNRMDSFRLLLDKFTKISWRNLILMFFVFEALKLIQGLNVVSLNFFFLGMSSAKYGVLLIMFRKTRSFLIRLIVLCPPLLEAVGSGMFQGHLASIFVILLLGGGLKKSARFFLLAVFSAILLPLLLMAKGELRRKAWGEEGLNLIGFVDVITETNHRQRSDGELLGVATEGGFELYRRLNQGWLVSAVLEREEHGKVSGDGLLLESFAASIIPRFLWPEKPAAGGQAKISNYTNLVLTNSTSMNISPFAEIVIQFSGFAAIVISFLYALFLCQSVCLLVDFSVAGRISFFIVPFILSQVYKVETDMVTVMNFLIKGFVFGRILLFIQNWMIQRIPEKLSSMICAPGFDVKLNHTGDYDRRNSSTAAPKRDENSK